MGGEPTCVPYERGTIPAWAGNCVYEASIAGAHGGAPLQFKLWVRQSPPDLPLLGGGIVPNLSLRGFALSTFLPLGKGESEGDCPV